jgi:superfamily II DNA or RNA helicase
MNRENVQKEALDITLQHKRCGLGISMGVGKTRIAIQHFQKHYDPFIKALVVIPKLSIKESWIAELEKMNLEDLANHLTFTTYLSINKHDPKDYQIVYLDECHSLLNNHEAFLSNFNGKILGLTGTPPVRQGTEKYRMVKKYCPIVYDFTVDEATDNNILNDYKIIVHQLDLDGRNNLKKKKKNGGHWFTSEVKDYQYCSSRIAQAQTQKQMQFASIMRMRSLMDYETKEDYVISLMNKIRSKCIVFANTQYQADRMCRHSYHSNNPKSQENFDLFSDGRITKMSCVLQLSEGVTIPNLKEGIIMHAYGNERKTSQRIGRLLRLNPNDIATCHILCYKDTIDEKWIADSLEGFDQNKIKYYNPFTY